MERTLSAILRRIAGAALVFLLVALIVFLAMRLAPGDPAALMVGETGTQEELAATRTRLDLDKPLPVQFGAWLAHALQGDLGRSFYHQKEVREVVAGRIGPSFLLGCLTMGFSLVAGVLLGALAAARRGWMDKLVFGLAVSGTSVPTFVLGYVLIALVALQAGWLPPQGYVRLGEAGAWQTLRHLLLPALALSLLQTALIARVTRATLAQALVQDYVLTARAKGLGEARIVLRHALPNAALPVVTVAAAGVASLISGVVVTEAVFAIPGIGQLTVDSVHNRDYPVIQGLALFFSFVYVIVNLAADLLYLLLDPRIEY